MRHDYYKEFDGSWPEPKHHPRFVERATRDVLEGYCVKRFVLSKVLTIINGTLSDPRTEI